MHAPRTNLRRQGAELDAEGVRYRTWAPEKRNVAAVVQSGDAAPRVISLGNEGDGYFSGVDPAGRAGDRYKFRLDGQEFPDPASRCNPEAWERVMGCCSGALVRPEKSNCSWWPIFSAGTPRRSSMAGSYSCRAMKSVLAAMKERHLRGRKCTSSAALHPLVRPED